MNQAGLRLEQAPPIWVPFLFFLAAPPFLLLAAAALLWSGPAALAARLSPAAIAIAHLYTLGFMTTVMIGSMMQMLPVLQGSPVPMPRTTAAIAFAGLAAGTLALASGFLFGVGPLLQAGGVALAAGFAVFVTAILVCLARAPSQNHTVRTMWLAVLALLLTVVFGAMLAALFGWGIALPSPAVLKLHPGWSLLGWTGLLVVGVGFEMVPMLQITPLYPRPMARYLGPAIFALLVLWSTLLWFGEEKLRALVQLTAMAMAIAYLAFGLVTLRLQRQRRRRLPDVTLDFWRLGMGSLALACLAWGARIAAPDWWPEALDILIGVLALYGFAGSVITGMLYKIMPFLAWFHLQSMYPPGKLAPNMKQIFPDRLQRRQIVAHAIALALLCAAAIWPDPLIYPAALALAAAAVLLHWNLIVIARAYARSRGQIPAAAIPA